MDTYVFTETDVSLICNINVILLVVRSLMECLMVTTMYNANDFFIIQDSKVCRLP